MLRKYGDIEDRWSHRRFDLRVTAAPNTGGNIAVLAGKHSLILADDHPIRADIADGHAGLDVRGDTYTTTIPRR